MSINRLFETIYYLIEHKQTTAKELAEHFEVSTRTIYRDLDRLIVAGFPIYANQGAKGGIYIDSEFVLDKMTFSDDEQNQILMALQCIERLQDRDEAGLIDKMAALFNKNKLDWIEVDFTTWHYNNSQNEKFETIKKAIFEQNEIKFKYINSYGEKSQRCVFPNKLFFKANTWYLQGYCLQKNSYRVFRLTRIIELLTASNYFQLEEIALPPKINKIPNLNTPRIKVILKFDKSIGSVVFDEFGDGVICEDTAGNYIVSSVVPDDYWLISFILSFWSKVEVIEPQDLKDKVIIEINKIKAVYKQT